MTARIRWAFGVLAAVLGASACTPTGGEDRVDPAEIEVAPVIETPLAPVGSLVLLPRVGGVRVTLEGDNRVSGPGIAEVIGTRDGLLVLRSIANDPEQLCVTDSVAPEFEVIFFAELAELQPVLVRRKRVELDDGTSFEFAPGVPVVNGHLDLGDVMVPAEFEPGEVGRWFNLDPPSQESGDPWDWSAPLWFGERWFVADSTRFNRTISRELVEGGVMLEFVSPCGQFRLRSEIAESSPPPVDAPQPETCTERKWLIERGTKLSWAWLGGEAGVVRATALVSTREIDAKPCFNENGFTVCVAPERARPVDTEVPCADEDDGDFSWHHGVYSLATQVDDPRYAWMVERVHTRGEDALDDCMRKHAGFFERKVSISYAIERSGEAELSRLEPSTKQLRRCLAEVIAGLDHPARVAGSPLHVSRTLWR